MKNLPLLRIVPLSTDEQNDFKKGKSITTSANRTEKRDGSRNKFRYKLRRADLINALKSMGFINEIPSLQKTTKILRTKPMN